MHHLTDGWLKGQCPQFYNIRDDLAVVDGVLLKLDRIVILHSMRQLVLEQPHEGHFGVEKCRRRAREAVYWPGINDDIANTVLNCPTCQRFQPDQPRETLQPHELVTSPWSKVSIDLFHALGRDYVLIVDYFLTYPEMERLHDITSSAVSHACKDTFARHGIPLTVISNNGPCFASQEWTNFARRYNFVHVTSSPLYPQCNGKAEKGVHVVKRLLCKAANAGSAFYLALLAYRSAQLSTGLSPAQLLMGRTLRTTLPSIHVPDLDHVPVLQRMQLSRAQHKAAHDARAADLPALAPDDNVCIHLPDGGWSATAVVLRQVAPRSFLNAMGLIRFCPFQADRIKKMT
ncbi:hypothetical protein scyTo_0000248 [Scyliorhinus torazame]|uniref:Gypsy retrotransposon integrase-like protein 1 n=1 Tax=Scyliorhinus torazame TaxID=75743 RepID=A0A401NTK0_SCYTO|nr:hypothetical protein [Scyliorhinus torazame]